MVIIALIFGIVIGVLLSEAIRKAQCKQGPRIKAWIERIRKEEAENKNFVWVPSTTDYEVVECLVELFLGEGWYAGGGWTSPPQVNTIILDRILYKYCKDYRKIAKESNSLWLLLYIENVI